jgi:hypothetical protein
MSLASFSHRPRSWVKFIANRLCARQLSRNYGHQKAYLNVL